ncbi:MAG: MBL fold metallo-hydrolase [Lachnospiraceae bacterium]|nr:MBL fold metallo-hydrolase [Lachnospiraceae bacterium]
MSIRVKKIIVGPVRTNCYIVYQKDRREAVIIDPGDEPEEISRKITEYGVVPKAILLTHGHFDHIVAAESLKGQFDIPVFAYEAEREILTTEQNLGSMVGIRGLFLEADTYLTDNQLISLGGMDFKVLSTPGHTVGSCCYLLEAEDVLFSGDTLFHYSHGRTDFPTGSQSAIIRSIRERLMTLKDDIFVYPGHEGETTIGNERQLYDYN